MLRNCPRCGIDFEGEFRKGSACPACQTVKSIVKHYSGQPLSNREKQVIELVRQGLTNKEIGYRLHLTTGTIKEYMVTIFLKLAIPNRVGLAIWAERRATRTIQNPVREV